MIYLHEKLENFTSNVIREAAETRDAMNAEIEEEIRRRTDSIKLEIRARYHEKLHSVMAGISKENNEKLSREILESKKQVLKMREEIVGKVFEDVENELFRFMDRDEYADFLAGTIEKGIGELGEGSFQAYLLQKDLIYIEKLQARFQNVSFQESDQDFIGGVMLFNTDKHTVYDGSVQKMIEQRRKDFIKEVGAIY